MTYRKYHETTDTSIDRINVKDAGWNAYDFAVEKGLIEAGIEDINELPSDLYIWQYDDPQETEYYATEEEANEAYEQAIDYYEAMEDEENGLIDDADDYFVIQKSLWQGDTWGVAYSTNDKAEADEIAELLSDDGLRENGQDLKVVVNTKVVTKQDLVHVFGWRISDAQQAAGLYYETVQEALYPSEAGAVNLYMPAGYKSKAEHLAAIGNYTDNRGNISISALIRALIDKGLKDGLW